MTEAGRNDAAIVGVFERMEGNQDPLAVLADAALAINAEQFALPVSVSKDVMSVPFEEMHPQRGPAPLKAMCHICSVFVLFLEGVPYYFTYRPMQIKFYFWKLRAS